jgi:hypothetical protein
MKPKSSKSQKSDGSKKKSKTDEEFYEKNKDSGRE